MRSLLLAVVLGVVAAGCGSSHQQAQTVVGGLLGKGADQVWLFRPAGTPKDVVVFITAWVKASFRRRTTGPGSSTSWRAGAP